MEEPKLWLVCLDAFVAVMALLWLIAITVRLLIILFSVKKPPNPRQRSVPRLPMPLITFVPAPPFPVSKKSVERSVMLHTSNKKTIKVILTAFRDGLQRVFGGKVCARDILPALQATAQSGIRHVEFGSGARYQTPLFYANENPFDSMDQMCDAAGKGRDLQILTRSPGHPTAWRLRKPR